MNNCKNTDIKGALDYAITMIHLRAKQEGIELSNDIWGVWKKIKEEYGIESEEEE